MNNYLAAELSGGSGQVDALENTEKYILDNAVTDSTSSKLTKPSDDAVDTSATLKKCQGNEAAAILPSVTLKDILCQYQSALPNNRDPE